MADDAATGATTPSPDEAFAALGNETRMEILQTLGEADDPLTFSDLYDRSETRDSGQFNYHLDRLVGHFIDKTDEGYKLARPGRRVVEAVLSGAVTDTPEFERTGVADTCQYCGTPIEIEWVNGAVELYCPECQGTYSQSYSSDDGATLGFLGRLPLPPAGIRDRSPDEVLRAAWTWGNLEILAISAGICPRCSATVEYDADVCEDHDHGEGRCPECDQFHAVSVEVSCTNCIFQTGGAFVVSLVADTDLLDLLTDHDLNPVAPSATRPVDRVHNDYEERIRSTDPFEADFTFSVGDDRLTLTVDDDLEVIEAER